MRGILVFVAGGLGLGALWRRRRRKSGADAGLELPYDDGRDPAEELRAKLAETQAKAAEVEGASAEEPEAEASPLDPSSRRRDVHERARASIDELG